MTADTIGVIGGVKVAEPAAATCPTIQTADALNTALAKIAVAAHRVCPTEQIAVAE